jgi:hypothetical protein
MKSRNWIQWVLCSWLVWSAFGCGGAAPIQPSQSAAVRPSSSTSAPPPAEQPATSAAHAPAGQASAAQPSAAKASAAASDASGAIVEAEAKPERPGLATQFGEDLGRTVKSAPFSRESVSKPFATTTIWYNDAAGTAAVAGAAQERLGGQAKIALFNGGLVVSLVDDQSRVLPGFMSRERLHAVGEANARYAIHIENMSEYTFEVVASVDGLSVTDGRPASIERRGYLVKAHDDMLIEGFRTSRETVAAFRFGKVSQSYSVEMGHGDRNVGVIGIAFFEEKGQRPVYSPEDTRLRETADPFPGDYAPRPKGR